MSGSRRFVVEASPMFWRDVDTIVRWLYVRSPQGAGRFLDRVQATLRSLELLPALGHRVRSRRSPKQHLRTRQVEALPNYYVVYSIRDSVVDVKRVRHSSRRWPPGLS